LLNKTGRNKAAGTQASGGEVERFGEVKIFYLSAINPFIYLLSTLLMRGREVKMEKRKEKMKVCI